MHALRRKVGVDDAIPFGGEQINRRDEYSCLHSRPDKQFEERGALLGVLIVDSLIPPTSGWWDYPRAIICPDYIPFSINLSTNHVAAFLNPSALDPLFLSWEEPCPMEV